MRNHINSRLGQVMSQFSDGKYKAKHIFSIGEYLVYAGFKTLLK